MWIIPSNHPLYSQFAPDLVDSKEELSMQPALQFEQSLMWKSKPLSLKTWCAKWNRVYWIPHLFGRMLKPSSHLHTTFVEKLTASLQDILVNPSQKPVNEKEKMIQDTFGRIYSESLKQYDLFGVSSKMSEDTSQWDMTKFTKTLEVLVTQLSVEYTQRKKLAQHMRENGFSSLPWPTPTAWQSGEEPDTFEARRLRLKEKWGKKTGNGAGETLNISVKKWTTPTLSSAKQGENEPDGKRSQTLIGQVRGSNWATPLSREVKKGFQTRADREKNGQQIGLITQVLEAENWGTPRSNEHKGSGPKGSKVQQKMMDQQYLSAQVEGTDGLLPKESSNIRGKRPVLSPAWTAQLMGTTLERIFFACWEMPLFTRQRPKHILTYSRNSDE